MKFCIENIGPISSAHIELTGLTVIGGFNDTGKSTIGKSLFAIVKSIRDKEKEYTSVQQGRINTIISELTSELRNILGARISPSSLSASIRPLSDIYIYNEDIKESLLENNLQTLRTSILRELSRRTIRELIDGKLAISMVEPDEKALSVIDNYILKIRELLTKPRNNDDIYRESFSKILSSIFHGEINNKRSKDLGTINIWDNETNVFNASFSADILKDIHVDESITTEIFEDVTFLESPMVLTYGSTSSFSPDNQGGYYFGNYLAYDLTQKLSFASKDLELGKGLEREISEIIANTINGRIYFNAEDDEFMFTASDGIEVKINNTASGVKTLGILQMLARAGILTGANLLVIDEPEVHLHPEWQIVYAEVIAILVKKYNIYCVVSSHSPYFIQAMEAYSKIYEMQNLTKFYISEKNNGVCVFRDITENPEPLYKLLADPMKRIAYLRAKAQNG